MIKFHSIKQIEHFYGFENAVAKTDVLNGDFGTVTDGEFATAANATKAIMLLEVGDDMNMPEYKIPKGTDLRVLDLAKLNGQLIEVYGAQLPKTFAKGDKLVSTATGALEVSSGDSVVAPYYEVTKIIDNKIGVEVKIVAE